MTLPRGVTLRLLALLAATMPAAGPLDAQLRLTAHHEYQFGNLPDAEPADLRALYQQVNLGFESAGFLASARSEAFRSSGEDRDYLHLAQRSLSYRHGGLEATAGHFYALVGRGVLLHAFELPGVITEDRVSRRRYQIVRDLDGARVSGRWRQVEVLALHGVPVNSELAPGLKGLDRRQGRVSGGAVRARVSREIEVGAGLIEFSFGGEEELGATTHGELRFGSLLERLGLGGWYGDLYGEYAQIDPAPDRWLSLDRDRSRALYLAGTLTGGAWGLSLELKDYDDFAFPSLNNPPTLIREHEAFLLNRETHALLADDETGVQAELTWALPRDIGLTAAWNLATRRGPDPGGEKSLREYFVQLDSPVGEAFHGQLFLDYTRNRILENERRLTAGTRWDWSAGGRHAASADLQVQDVDRRFGRSEFPYENLLGTVELSRYPAWTWSLQLQRSNDPLEAGASESGATYWWALGASWRFRDAHTLDVFGGRRRTGLACTGGSCYEVLGFEGIELRLTSEVL